MTSWAELLLEAEPGEHLVQLFGADNQLLTRNASRYLAEGLRRGDGLVVIARPEHIHAIVRHLVEDEPRAGREAEIAGRLVCLDAGETLERFLVAGRPDAGRFREVIGGIIAQVRASSETRQVRAFGEMVSLLWERGAPEDAARLEELWNSVLSESGCSLLCGYAIDLFDGSGEPAALHPIIASHHHVLAGAGTLLSRGRPRADPQAHDPPAAGAQRPETPPFQDGCSGAPAQPRDAGVLARVSSGNPQVSGYSRERACPTGSTYPRSPRREPLRPPA